MTWRFAPAAALIAIVLTSQGADAALQSRLGGLAYYDDQLDITWAADANLIGFGTWGTRMDALPTLMIGGVSGWRLPNMDVNGDGTVADCSFGSGQTACKDNEYGHMHYYGAGTAWNNGITPGGPGPFTGLSIFGYWSSTVVPPTDAYYFSMSNGQLSSAWTENIFGAWVVRDGDVAAVSLTGDLDGDGFVGIADLNIVLGNWNQNVPPGDPLADPSGDGFVGIDDLNAVLGNWNAGIPPGDVANIPEPTSALLMGLLGAGLLTRRRTAY
jgi:hypothetical protein